MDYILFICLLRILEILPIIVGSLDHFYFSSRFVLSFGRLTKVVECDVLHNPKLPSMVFLKTPDNFIQETFINIEPITDSSGKSHCLVNCKRKKILIGVSYCF
jgi:hypothetical protein